MIPVNVIGTGSAGNAVVVNDNLMIDCGLPYKAIEPYLDRVKLIVLTHVHGDHFNYSTIKRIGFNKPLIRFGCRAYLAPDLIACGIPARQIDIYVSGSSYNYGIFKIESFLLTHDVPNCGYKVHYPDGQHAIYATDTENMNGIDAKNYDLFMIEANYGEEEIKRRIDDHKINGEYAYERRVVKTHMSQEQADDFIARNAGPNSSLIYMHKHKERGGNENGESNQVSV